MAPFDRNAPRRPALRCRDWAALVGDSAAAARLRALSLEMDEQWGRFAGLNNERAGLEGQRRRLLNEIDAVVRRAKEALLVSRNRLASVYSAGALREESRLCREEAQITCEMDERQAFASRALALAQFGEMVDRR